MNNIKSSVVAALVIFVTSQALAISPDKVSFNIGMGYGGFDNDSKRYRSVYFAGSYYWLDVPKEIINRGYNLYTEGLYRLNNNVTFGFGIQYFFGGIDDPYSDYQTFQDDYDNRKPHSEDLRGFHEDIDFIMPFITAKYSFEILRVDLFSKFSIGYGSGRLESYHELTGKIKEDAYGLGLIPSIGKSFSNNKRTAFNIELGYRYIKTAELDENALYVRYYGNHLNFSGPFVQSSFSFNL